MRARRGGACCVWVSSSSSAGGAPPYLSPYFAAKAAMDALAVQLCPRAGPLGDRDLDHRAGRLHQGHQSFRPFRPSGGRGAPRRLEAGPLSPALASRCRRRFAEIVPDDADPAGVADEIVKVVAMPFGKRPFRLHYDPTQGRRGYRLHRARPPAGRDAAPRRRCPDLLKPAARAWRRHIAERARRSLSGTAPPGLPILRRNEHA